jgi:hypothetical protein
MTEQFLKLSLDDRRDVLAIAAEKAGRPIHLLEKDTWVVWALQTLYGTALGDHLVFKGGTSLSKAYNAIRRFSEDVDLTYDIRELAHDLVGENEQALPETRSEEKRWSSEVRKRLPIWVSENVSPLVVDAISGQSLPATVRVEADKLFIDYEAVAGGSGYVAPSVMLEFGARSTGEPQALATSRVTLQALWMALSFQPPVRGSCMPNARFGKKRRQSTSSACRSGSAESAFHATGTISFVLTISASPTAQSRIATWPSRWRSTNRCFSPRKRPTERRLTMKLAWAEGCS